MSRAEASTIGGERRQAIQDNQLLKKKIQSEEEKASNL